MLADTPNSSTFDGTKATLETAHGTYTVQAKRMSPIETIWDLRDEVLIPLLLAAGFHHTTVNDLFFEEAA